MNVAQVHIVTFGLLLVGGLSDKLDRLHGTRLDAGLFAARTALLTPIRSVEAQVAFGGLADGVVPHRPMGPLRTHLEADFAANTLLAVDSPDVAVLGIHIGGADRTIFHAHRREALAAGRQIGTA